MTANAFFVATRATKFTRRRAIASDHPRLSHGTGGREQARVALQQRGAPARSAGLRAMTASPWPWSTTCCAASTAHGHVLMSQRQEEWWSRPQTRHSMDRTQENALERDGHSQGARKLILYLCGQTPHMSQPHHPTSFCHYGTGTRLVDLFVAAGRMYDRGLGLAARGTRPVLWHHRCRQTTW